MKSLFWYKEYEGEESQSVIYNDINKTFQDNNGEELDSYDVRNRFMDIDDNADYALCPNVTLKEVYDAIRAVENAENNDDTEDDDGPWTT